jgi:N-acetylglucosaminyl-diphospho-decaprenol L-rhamnosyltransferase
VSSKRGRLASGPLVLFVSYSGAYGGAERLLVDFAAGLERECSIACPPGELAGAARCAGVRTFPLRQRSLRLRGGAARRGRAVRDLAGHARELRALTRALDPDVLVLWGMRSALASLLVGGLGQTAFQHNDFLPGRLTGALVRRAARRAELVTAPSRAVLGELGVGGEVIAPGVALERFALSAEPASPPEILVLGALAQWKRPDLALEAFGLLRERHPEARLTFVGTAFPGEEPSFAPRLNDPTGAVRLAGAVPDPADELSRCTCLLHCAEREPFGIAVVEALAAGRPAVVPDAAGPAEIVDESCGVRYPPGDARAAADALAAVLGDPARAARMGAAGRARVAQRFALEAQRARYRTALAALGGASPPRSRAELTIVTVTHNSAGVLPVFLESVQRHLPDVPVVVADCASRDGTPALARERGSEVLELDNVGFGAACNRALAQVGTPVTALLNPDVELVDDSLLELASEALARERLLAPRVLNPDGSLQESAHPVPGSLVDLLRALVPPAIVPGAVLAPWRSRRPRRVGWAVGAALVARTATLRALGPFDERIFLYGEDMDLGLRAARRGIETWLWPAVRVIHRGGHSIEAAHGGEPFELRARARHEALTLALGPRRAALDDRMQALTFRSRRTLKRALGRPAERERRQLEAVRALPGSRWERFASRDPQYYIDPGAAAGRSVEDFREGGRAVVEWALAWAGALPDRDRALEIGSGLGRNTVHLARHFARVDGVDVSPTMVRSAGERGLPGNVALRVVSGQDLRPLPDASYAFVFSHLVFQHIEAWEAIDSYLQEICRVLEPAGVAVLQFDTRPLSPLIAMGHRLPDVLLPRERRRGIRRQRRNAQAIRSAAAAAGLELEEELQPDSAEHWLRWRRGVLSTDAGMPRPPSL